MPNIVFSHSVFWDAPIDDLAVYVGSNFRKPTLDGVSTFSLMHFYHHFKVKSKRSHSIHIVSIQSDTQSLELNISTTYNCHIKLQFYWALNPGFLLDAISPAMLIFASCIFYRAA